MTIKIEEMISDRIIVVSITPPIALPEDPAAGLTATVAFKQKASIPVVRIMDFSASELKFTEMMIGLAGEINQPGGFWDKEVYSILLGTNEWVQLGGEVIRNQNQYEGADIKGLVATRDEALALARSLLQE